MLAARQGNTRCLRLLLRAGADPNVGRGGVHLLDDDVGAEGHVQRRLHPGDIVEPVSAVELAARGGTLPAVQQLLLHGARGARGWTDGDSIAGDIVAAVDAAREASLCHQVCDVSRADPVTHQGRSHLYPSTL